MFHLYEILENYNDRKQTSWGGHSGRRKSTAKGMSELFEEMVMFYSMKGMVVL